MCWTATVALKVMYRFHPFLTESPTPVNSMIKIDFGRLITNTAVINSAAVQQTRYPKNTARERAIKSTTMLNACWSLNFETITFA